MDSPVSGVDPRRLSCVVIDEVHFSVEVLGDVPPFRKRYLPIPSPWHISLRSKSIQNSLSATRSTVTYTRYRPKVSRNPPPPFLSIATRDRKYYLLYQLGNSTDVSLACLLLNKLQLSTLPCFLYQYVTRVFKICFT